MIEVKTGRRKIFVCCGTGCVSGKSDYLLANLKQEVAKRGLKDVEVDFSGCHGFCQRGPIVDIAPDDIFYTEVQPDDAADIVRSLVGGDGLVDRLLYHDPVSGQPMPHSKEVVFYKKQHRLILRNCGSINPENIDHYLAVGGYEGLSRALLKMKPLEVIEEVKKSGLRGRGGAGFSTGQKWEFCRNAKGSPKYMICNADEGDPGAFMDRSILEADPHSLVEGMTVAGYAIGASEGYIYVRAEYPLAVVRVRKALKDAEAGGFLGKNILNSGFDFKIHVMEGAGAFVCGEETALMASIMGRRGMPRPRPPFPANAGLWERPSNINNVKTLASVTFIMLKGEEAFASLGTEKSKGTAVFALTGKVANSGLVEVPMGTTLREIIFEIGGGIPNNKRFKAVQTGGPSGGCLTAAFLDSPVDYESLAQAGSIMGSGGMVVGDEDTCMVDLARFFLSFTKSESCGKCTPCRVGTQHMLAILERIGQGKGEMSDLDLLAKLTETTKNASLCGLGQTCPNPIITTMRYFRDEYEDHIKRKHCEAVACRDMVGAPCTHTCPAGMDAARYIRLIRTGKFGDAAAVTREKAPFPYVLGHVCFAPCQSKCRRGQVDEFIGIRALKRFASENDDGAWLTKSKKSSPTGKKVAVVGSGPAGLTAAYYLAKQGQAVTVLESLPVVGGMMRVGIPEYRLPRWVLEKEVKVITEAGVEIRTSTCVESVDELFQKGYHAVFLAVGAHQGIKLGVNGEETSGVLECVDFLREVSLGKEVKVGKRVAVIGGGNAAIDAARTALRVGAKEVSLIYRRTRQEMPANPEEVEEAHLEGVKLVYLTAPSKIARQNSHLGLECLKMQLGKIDASGRRRPEPVKGSEFVEPYDTVIAAVGQRAAFPAKLGLEMKDGVLKVDRDTLATSRPGVFAGGDCVSGPASVIEAIAAARTAARSIDKYLGGDGDISEVLAPPDDLSELPPIMEGEKPREPMPCLTVDKRFGGFERVELGYERQKAVEETSRCLRCDLEDRS
jgi:NADH-quinone oxidoreductase subunit F